MNELYYLVTHLTKIQMTLVGRQAVKTSKNFMPQYITSDFNFFIDSEFEKLFSILFLLFIRKIRYIRIKF